MLLLAVVLLIVGIVLVLAPLPLPNVDLVGWLLIVVGAILLLVVLLTDVVHIDRDHAQAAIDYVRSSWSRQS